MIYKEKYEEIASKDPVEIPLDLIAPDIKRKSCVAIFYSGHICNEWGIVIGHEPLLFYDVNTITIPVGVHCYDKLEEACKYLYLFSYNTMSKIHQCIIIKHSYGWGLAITGEIG